MRCCGLENSAGTVWPSMLLIPLEEIPDRRSRAQLLLRPVCKTARELHR